MGTHTPRRTQRFSRRAGRLLFFCLIILMGLSGCPRPIPEEIQVTVTDEGGGEALRPPSLDTLISLARQEGIVNWYTSITEQQALGFARQFETKYPGIRVQLQRGGTFSIIEKIEKEISKGRVQADVLQVLDPAIFVSLAQRGELFYYEAPEAAAVPAAYKSPGYWTAVRLVALGLAYNPQQIAPSQLPRRWSDLLQARWQGKIGLKDALTAGSAYALYYLLRELYGVAYWRKMAQLQPRIYKTEEAMLEALSQGEIKIAAGLAISRLLSEDAHAKHIKTIWPQDGIPLIIGPVAILKRAPHPNAARLFVRYMLSQEGQMALRDLLGTYPARSDLAEPAGCPALASLPLLQPISDWTEYLEKQSALRTEFVQLFNREESE